MENKNNELNNTCTTLPYIWVPTNDAITRDTFKNWVNKHLSQPLNTAAGHQSHDCLVLLFQRIVWRLQLYLLTQIYMNKDVKSKKFDLDPSHPHTNKPANNVHQPWVLGRARKRLRNWILNRLPDVHDNAPTVPKAVVMYVGVIRYVAHVLQRLLIIFTPRSLCWINKSTTKHQQKLDWKSDLPWLSYGYLIP